LTKIALKAETAPDMATGPKMDLGPASGPGPDSEMPCDDVKIKILYFKRKQR
jgi:hypothetical protein